MFAYATVRVSDITMTFRKASLLAWAALWPLAACAPNLGEAPKPRAAASLAAGRSLPAEGGAWPGDGWWRRYGDSQLDQLIAEGLAGSPDVASAAARILRARGLSEGAGADLGPQLDGQGSAGKVKQSYNNGFPREFLPQGWRDTANLDLRASIDLDLWGRNRAQLRASLRDEDAARVDAAQARITLASSIAASYADLARLFAERDIAEQTVVLQRDTATLVANRVAGGLDTEGQRQQAAAQIPAAQTDLAAIDEQIATTRNRLAALVGAGPDRGLAITRPALSGLVQAALPSSAGIDLVGRRPDIVAARARVEAAAERIKVARTAFYPDISLSGLAGLQALGFANVLKGGSTYGNVGPAVSLPLFDSGRRAGDYRVARSDYDVAVADYDRTLIAALEDVANAIASRNSLATQTLQSRASLAGSESAYRIARLRYQGGLSTYLDVLSAEQSVIVARRRDADLAARAFALDVALVRALGGGFASA